MGKKIGDKNKKESYLHCKIQSKLKMALIKKATKENKSMGSVVRAALRNYLKT